MFCSISARSSAERWARGRGLWLVMALGLGAAAPAADGLPESLKTEVFEVGRSVYVRALEPIRAGAASGSALDRGNGDRSRETDAAAHLHPGARAGQRVRLRHRRRSRGGVWFGTNGGGTSRWQDGSWETYFPMHGLADYWVYSYAFDAAGTGLDRHLGRREPLRPARGHLDHLSRRTREHLGLRHRYRRFWPGLVRDRRRRVDVRRRTWREWTHEDGLGAPNRADLPASENTGLGTRDRHDLSVYVDGQESYNPNYVFAAEVDDGGRGIWFGTWGGGLSLFDGVGRWQNFTTADGLPGQHRLFARGGGRRNCSGSAPIAASPPMTAPFPKLSTPSAPSGDVYALTWRPTGRSGRAPAARCCA